LIKQSSTSDRQSIPRYLSAGGRLGSSQRTSSPGY
jgi:hypothetical protein